MKTNLATTIAQAREEIDVAIARMKAGIRLCEGLHDKVGGAGSQADIDDLMRAAFGDDPIGYSLLVLSNSINLIHEEEGGWRHQYLSAMIYALDRIEFLAATMTAVGLVSDAALQDSEKATMQLMQLLRFPKGMAN